MNSGPAVNLDEQLIEELGSYAYDPLAFVLWAFPWGEPGELAGESGPDEWQEWLLCQVRDGLLSTEQAIQLAITSGHGVGKSAAVAWLCWWAYSTFPGTRGIVTANTENQLKTKTWVEIAKWHRMFIAKHLFKCTATAIFSVDEATAREWRIDIVPWSERNTEAFAGLHNAGKRIIIIFDEASAIPDVIWETTEGALTDKDTEIMWFVFGNPTRTTGRFRSCFPGGQFERRWISREVNSLKVRRTNKKQLRSWIEDYGEDSDFCRVRIFGKFPRSDTNSFIDAEMVREACKRVVVEQDNAPVVLGVDVARFGDDLSVIWPRQGRDASSREPQFFSGLTTVQLTQHIMLAADRYAASAVFIDGGGVGGGVVDQCRSLGLNVIEVQFGASPDGFTKELCGNKRAEIYTLMRDWLKTGSIPETIAARKMPDEFAATGYTINMAGKIMLEPKAIVKRRDSISPDFPDALAVTFAMPDIASGMFSVRRRAPRTDYNPFSEEFINA